MDRVGSLSRVWCPALKGSAGGTDSLVSADDADRAEIVAAFLATLRGVDSPLLAPELEAGLVAQVNAIVDDVVARLSPSALVDDSSQLLALEIGTSRAHRGIHPAESLRAATALFEIMLPVLVRRHADGDAMATMRISRILHESIMERVGMASLSYVTLLLDKLQASRREERVRIARELHDRVLHSMGLTLQQLDLFRHLARTGEPPLAKIDAAIDRLGEAVRSVQQLTAEMRRSVGNGGLEAALGSYVRENVPEDVRVGLTFQGEAKSLPADIAEELYLILREAVRNAVRHAHPAAVTVHIDVDTAAVRAMVRDDGTGFDATDDARLGGGVPSMRERALLLNGRLDLASSPDGGTTVTVVVPLPDAFR
jgi:signal transduction histidine kinase